MTTGQCHLGLRPPSRQAAPSPSSAVIEQERHDGSAVVDLLSQADDDAPTFHEEPSISEGELETLRRAPLSDGPPSASGWDNMLNFIPDFVRSDPDGGYTQGHHDSWKAEQTRSTLGLAHSPEAAHVWLEQWQDVLRKYTDEVWGDLTPLVRQAREEVAELETQPGRPSPDVTALLRLRQILGHIRGS